jgi:cation diffusion facilitator CzcD-associated flavoprotein CzcO
VNEASTLPPHVGVLVVGGGFAGLGAAIALERAGRRDVIVIERGREVGGTWRDNTYPGAACDVPSQLYSFSFALNPRWTRSYSPQAEIQDYLRRVAAESGALARFRFGCELLGAIWDGDAAHWKVETSLGAVTASVLVTAFGALCEPALPAIEGIEQFGGPVIHSARWRPDHDLAGLRVAVIGSGASAIQLVPAIADRVAHLDVYQRTAPWILPHSDHAYSRWQRLAFARLPGWQRLVRGVIYTVREFIAIGFAYRPALLGFLRRQASAHLNQQVADPQLRQRLTPDFAVGCKRVLISNNWYPTLQRENVELITDAIANVTADAVITEDGRTRPVDAIVVATGFRVTDSPAAELITGSEGRTLGEQWRRFGQQAYKGTAVAGFPNYFMLVGPNTGLGHTSMLYIIESQLAYLLDALANMDRFGLATLEVRPDYQQHYNDKLQRRMKKTVWLTGCRSWYLDAHGRNTTLWPGFSFAFRWITRRFDLAAYRSTASEDRR